MTDPVNPYNLTQEEITFYHQYGYLPLPNFIRQEAIAGLHDEVVELVTNRTGVSYERLCQADGDVDRLRQVNEYVAGSQLDQMLNGKNMLATASQLVGGPAHRYLPFTAIKAGGGGGVFDMHQDNNYTEHSPGDGSINIWVALVDMTPENGCLYMAPESHKNGQVEAVFTEHGDGHRKVASEDFLAIPLRMRAGDAVAFTRWTIHGSGANNTNVPRVAYAMQYHREDVKYNLKGTDEWKSLLHDPRWNTEPVADLSAVCEGAK